MALTPYDCPACGQVHRQGARCHSRHRDDRGDLVPCHGKPVADTGTCRMHGVGAKQVRGAVRRRKETAAAKTAVATFGLPVPVDPAQALLDEVARSLGHVLWLGDQVRQLEPEGISVTDGGGRSRPSVRIELYGAERRHLREVAEAAVRGGAQQKVSDSVAALVDVLAGLIEAIVRDLGLDPMEPRVRAVLHRRFAALHAVEAGAGP